MLKQDFNYIYNTTIGQIVFDHMCQSVLFTKEQMLDEMSSNTELVAVKGSKVMSTLGQKALNKILKAYPEKDKC